MEQAISISVSTNELLHANVMDTHKQRTPTVKGQRRRRPAWTDWNFVLPAEKPAKPQPCDECGVVAIPHAHYMKKRFCSFQCGKIYLKRRRSAKEAGQATED